MDKILAFFRSLLYRFRVWLTRFMTGILSSFIGSLFGFFLPILSGYAAEIYTLFRIFSKNLPKRQEENRKYLKWSANVRFQIKAFFTRQKMRKEYKYFRCPGCKSLMRLHRGRVEVEMDCPKCHTHFKKKA